MESAVLRIQAGSPPKHVLPHVSAPQRVPQPEPEWPTKQVYVLLGLREQRLRKNWSVYALSRASGVGVGTIIRAEGCIHQPQIATMHKLADALECTIEVLLGPEQFDTGTKRLADALECTIDDLMGPT